jgi:O-antigen/teichoic acid export membrane protein
LTKLKELFSDTLIYGISSVLARFINYLLVPLHTKVFQEAQYGIISLIFAAITFLNVIFTFGMESAYLRYAKDREHARSFFKTIQLSLLGFASVLALLLWLSAPLIMPVMSLDPATKSIYLMMIGIVWFDTLSIVPFAELRLVRKSLQYAAIRTMNVLINVGLNVYLILFQGWNIEAVFMANVAASGITTVFIWLLTANMWKGDWSRAIFDKAVHFGMPFVPAGLGFAINEVLDRFMIKYFLSDASAAQFYGAGTTSEDVVGIYSACYKLAVFMLLLIQMFRMAWQPFFLRHADDEEAPELYADVFLYFNAAAALVFLGVGLFAVKIVQIPVPFLDAYLIDSKMWSGLTIVPVLLGAYWFHGWYMNFSAGVFIEEKTEILPKITLFGAVVTVIANALLIPYLGMMGAAFATLLSYASMALFLYLQVRRVYPVLYPLKKVFLMMVLVAGCLFLQDPLSGLIQGEWISSGILLILGAGGLIVLAWWGTRATSARANESSVR